MLLPDLAGTTDAAPLLSKHSSRRIMKRGQTGNKSSGAEAEAGEALGTLMESGVGAGIAAVHRPFGALKNPSCVFCEFFVRISVPTFLEATQIAALNLRQFTVPTALGRNHSYEAGCTESGVWSLGDLPSRFDSMRVENRLATCFIYTPAINKSRDTRCE